MVFTNGSTIRDRDYSDLRMYICKLCGPLHVHILTQSVVRQSNLVVSKQLSRDEVSLHGNTCVGGTDSDMVERLGLRLPRPDPEI